MLFTYPPQALATDSPTQAHFRIWVLLPERNNGDTAAAPSAKHVQIHSDISKHAPHPLPRGQDFNFLKYEASAVAPVATYFKYATHAERSRLSKGGSLAEMALNSSFHIGVFRDLV